MLEFEALLVHGYHPTMSPEDIKEPKQCTDSCHVQPSCARSCSPEDADTAHSFRELWPKVTDDNYLTLYGFRQFWTSHLLNLRFLEEEIDRLDNKTFQAGVKLGYTPTPVDKLGLRHAKRDANALKVEEVMTRENLLQLRGLLKQHSEQEPKEVYSWTNEKKFQTTV